MSRIDFKYRIRRNQEKVREDNKLTEVAELMLAVKDLEL